MIVIVNSKKGLIYEWLRDGRFHVDASGARPRFFYCLVKFVTGVRLFPTVFRLEPNHSTPVLT